MKRTLSVLALLVLALPLAAQMGAHPQPFSADMNVKTSRGNDITGKYYFGGQKFRTDMNMQGRNVYTIIDPQSQTTEMVMPDQKMYMEMKGAGRGPAAQAMSDIRAYDPSDPCKSFADHTCKKVGSDSVDGRPCDKWEITDKSGETATACIDKKLMFPIRMESKDATIEFTHVKEGMPDASLFTVPSDYRKMDMGGMMGGRPPHQPQD